MQLIVTMLLMVLMMPLADLFRTKNRTVCPDSSGQTGDHASSGQESGHCVRIVSKSLHSPRNPANI